MERINKRGYIEVWMPDHPAQHDGWVLQHRVIMEKEIGTYLSKEQVVHHINEIKTDNRILNLYLCTQEEHARIHNRIANMSQAKRAEVRRAVRAARK